MPIDSPLPKSGASARPMPNIAHLAEDARRLCGLLDNAEIERQSFLEQCTRLVSAAVGCSRAGIWVFVDTTDGRILRCVAMFDAAHQRMTRVPDETDALGPYFEALQSSGVIVADDARAHPATAGIFAGSLATNGVRSLLAVSVSVNGRLYGAFTCTQVGSPVQWSPRQVAVVRQIAPPISFALYKATRYTADTGIGPLI